MAFKKQVKLEKEKENKVKIKYDKQITYKSNSKRALSTRK